MKSSNSPLRRVIVRAWGNEPVALWAHRTASEGNVVFVGPSDCDRPIGLPREHVFEFKDGLMERLMDAYEGEETDKLLNVYASCNTYQDIVDSPHGQEHVAHSGSAPGRHCE